MANVMAMTLGWAIQLTVYGLQLDGREIEPEEVGALATTISREVLRRKRSGEMRKALEKGQRH